MTILAPGTAVTVITGPPGCLGNYEYFDKGGSFQGKFINAIVHSHEPKGSPELEQHFKVRDEIRWVINNWYWLYTKHYPYALYLQPDISLMPMDELRSFSFQNWRLFYLAVIDPPYKIKVVNEYKADKQPE